MKNKEKITIWFNGPVEIESDGNNIKITGVRTLSEINDLRDASFEEKIDNLRNYILEKIDLENLEIPDEYYYSCLALCLLDAIFSIGVHYTCVKNVVENFSNYTGIKLIRNPKTDEPPKDEKYTVDKFIEMFEDDGMDFDKFADDVVKNHHRTSTSKEKGILKAEAVYKCAKILQDANIHTIEDFDDIIFKEDDTALEIEKKYKAVPGQESGISFSYLKMLCGDENTLKPDRHVLRFLSRALGYDVEKEEAEKLISQVVDNLKKTNSELTVRALDYAIWNKMRSEA